MGCGTSKEDENAINVMETQNIQTDDTVKKIIEEEKNESENQIISKINDVSNNNITVNNENTLSKKIKPASEINVNLHKHDYNLLMDSTEEKLSEINFKPNRKMKQFKTRYSKDIKKLNLSEISDIDNLRNHMKKQSRKSKEFDIISTISEKKHVRFKSAKRLDLFNKFNEINKNDEKENKTDYNNDKNSEIKTDKFDAKSEKEKSERNEEISVKDEIYGIKDNEENEIEEIEEKENENDDDIEMGRISLRSRKKTKKSLSSIEIKKDPLWRESKKLFFEKLIEEFDESEVDDNIDVSITSIINLIKTDFSKYTILQKFRIQLIKKSNEVNWNKPPYNTLKKNLLKIPLLNPLLEKYIILDFNNNSLNEFEPFLGEVKMVKLNCVNDKLNTETSILSAETITQNTLLLIFDFDNNESICLLKEVLEFLKNKKKKTNKNEFQFYPIYAPFLDNATITTNYVWDIAKKNEFNNDLEIYFMENESLNDKFQYITYENETIITCKYIIIDSTSIIRKIGNPKNFTFNLLTQMDIIDKNDYEIIKTNLTLFAEEKNYFINDLQKHPISCSLFLNKTTIYSYDKSDRLFVSLSKYYDTLTGEVNNEDNILELYQDLDEVGKYEKRANPKIFNLSHKKKTNMISNVLGEIFKNSLIENLKYVTKFEKNTIYMKINPNQNSEQKFKPLKLKSFILDSYLTYNDFLQRHHYPITSVTNDITQFPFSKNLNYISCILAIGEQFPNTIKVYNSETKNQINLTINENGNNPTLIIVFSPSSKNYLAKVEMIYRFKQIYKKIYNLKHTLNIFLIYRGELYPFEEEMSFFRNEDIFKQKYPIYICPPGTILFPLYYQNNGIETNNSQIRLYLLDRRNVVAYNGMGDDINLRGSILNLFENGSAKYIKNYPVSYDDFTKEIKPRIKDIEKIFEKNFSKCNFEENLLLYRPYISFSYCKCDKYVDDKCDNETFMNNLRMRILIKEKHQNLVLKNSILKQNVKVFKDYGTTILIIPISCEQLLLENKCELCKKEISQNDPFFYNQIEKVQYCLDCEKTLNNKQVYLIYIKSKNYNNEIISDLYSLNIRYDSEINPVLGIYCKLCYDDLDNEFYLNLTHFNHLSQISPMLPIDICKNCFDVLNNGGKFIDKKAKENFNKYGFSASHIIYRKIKNNSLVKHNNMVKSDSFDF